MLKTIHDVIKDIFKTASDVDLHKNRQERCHPLGWLMNCRNLLLTNFCNYFTLKLLKRNFLLQKKIKIGGAIKNTECLEQTSAEISTS